MCDQVKVKSGPIKRTQVFNFTFTKEELFESEAFKNDIITEGVNDLNISIQALGKCRGVKIQNTSSIKIIDLDGYLITEGTLLKLIAEGTVSVVANYNG